MHEMNRHALAAEIQILGDCYPGQPWTPSRIAEYLALLPPATTVGELREGRRDAMRESGDFPPGPGSVAKAVSALRRRREEEPAVLRLPAESSEERAARLEAIRKLRDSVAARWGMPR